MDKLLNTPRVNWFFSKDWFICSTNWRIACSGECLFWNPNCLQYNKLFSVRYSTIFEKHGNTDIDIDLFYQDQDFFHRFRKKNAVFIFSSDKVIYTKELSDPLRHTSNDLCDWGYSEASFGPALTKYSLTL